MKFIETLFNVVIHQFKNLVKLLLLLPITTPPIVAVTLDEDDVKLASWWLERKNDWYSNEEIIEYQKEFSQWNGSTYSFSFLGGRVALSAIISALGLSQDDEVILPGYTCVVVPNSFKFAGVKTVYTDIELDTYGLDASQIENQISSRTRAIVIQHLFGLVNRDYEEILEIARRHSLLVIEDCAHSAGAEFQGRKVGNWGDVAFYSSERSKVYSTVLGGMATTNNHEIASELHDYQQKAPYPEPGLIQKQLYNIIIDFYTHKHPQRWWRGDMARLRYWDKQIVSTTDEEIEGIQPKNYGYKMPAPIASIGRNQLRKVSEYNNIRITTAKRWDDWCDKNGYKKPLILAGSKPIYLRYPTLVEPSKKEDGIWALRSLGVQIGNWFTGKNHPIDESIINCPNSDFAVSHCINFPTNTFK